MASPHTPLALFDLDNTLIDRAGAFRTWARGFVESRSLRHEEVAWLERTDDDGLLPRDAFFDLVRIRYHIDDAVEDLVAAYRNDYPRSVEPVGPETVSALQDLKEHGWKIVIVSNGGETQELKIEVAGLRDVVDGWAISEVVGARKPDPQIFHAAADLCGYVLDGAWVIGDSATADIAGARACGLRSIWISRGRQWRPANYRPDLIAESIPEAVQHLLRLVSNPLEQLRP